ncbi:DUF3772 domain-containing protein [Tropicimonas sp. TH_r6]|uniref:DUF3772 domain-containing protein n=1 Tax=Tropicimonas sp. TH_r6 TaxID=3082085 RepID=UPI0029555C98|nr:DUF3772 domain-containing protein [Tropicimonas sp. TH_r6]MDV7144442.1 DUF3772 domain-containing protein [Tropicimonas sp. TH_r6]
MRRFAGFLCIFLLSLLLLDGVSPREIGGGGAAAFAQEAAEAPLGEEDYVAWEKVALRAEASLASRAASDAAFEVLRRDLADWRIRFQAEETRDGSKIKLLQAQIAALGPAPEEGERESAELAARRDELQGEYEALITPVRKAEEAYARANGLIGQIDRLIRSRQKDLLLQRGPSPVNPNHVVTALEDLQRVVVIVLAEISSAAHLQSDQTRLRDNLLQILVLTLLALVLLIRGREWFRRLVDWILHLGADGGRSGVAAAMVVSLGQFILPVFGVMLLTQALKASSMFGPSGEGLLNVIPAMGIAFFTARWLGGQTFPRHEDWPVSLELTTRERVRGRFYSSSLGLLFASALLVEGVIGLFPLEAETSPVIAFPIIVLTTLCLVGLARLLISHGAKVEEADSSLSSVTDATDERSFIDRSILLIGRACLAFAFAAPFLALLGYTRAAIFFSLSPSLTLSILAIVTFLQRLSRELFELVFGATTDGAKGLVPVLFDFALMVAALPFIARAWGVRQADLDELWVNVQEGVVVGDTQISPTVLLIFLMALAAGIVVTRLVQAAMRASILPRTRIDPGGQKAMVSGIGYLGLFASGMIAVSAAGLDLSNLAIVAGALSVGVGFGLQNIVSNFVSGLILLIERPVTEGDWIEVGGIMGTVKKISVRATTVETFDRTDVVVPNSDFVSNQVTNWTRGNLSGRLILAVGVAYGTDTRKVAAILQEIAEAHPLVIVNPPPLVVFQGFGADSLDFEMRVILRDINFGLGTRSELNHQIAERFATEGIEIPFAQRDIWLRNPEALRVGGTAEATPVADPVAATPAPIGPQAPDSQPESPTEDD